MARGSPGIVAFVLDISATPSAASPRWSLVATVTPAGPGRATLSAEYRLKVGTLQAVRAVLRNGGADAVCNSGTRTDHDDLIFGADTAAFTDPALTPGVHVIRAAHVIELREMVNGLRDSYGLPAVTWTDPGPLSAIRAVHITELRAAVIEIYESAGLPPPVSSDSPIVARVTPLRMVHVVESRKRFHDRE